MFRTPKKQKGNIRTPLNHIEESVYPLIMAPWNGDPLGMVQVKRLSQTEIESCGEVSLIETFIDKRRAEAPTERQVHQYGLLQHRILKKALISPSYDQIMDLFDQKEMRKKFWDDIQELKRQAESLKTSPKKTKDLREVRDLERQYFGCFPGDFTGAVMATALSIDKSDIKNITEDMLLKAAILADKGHKRPSELIGGTFTDFNKADIDLRAWNLKAEKDQKNARRRRNNKRPG